MRNIMTIAKREWLNFFINPTGYIFAGLLLIITNWMFFGDFFLLGQADLKQYWSVMVFLFSIFVPAIAMGLIAEEKKNSTWEIMLSMPVNEKQFVLGKFFGSALYLLFTIGLSLPVIVTVLVLGKPEVGIIVGGMIGTIFLALSYLALGIFMSSLSNQPIVGFLGSTVALLLNNLMGQDVFLSRLPSGIRSLFESLSLNFRSAKFGTGLVELTDLVFFISWIVIFLALTVLSLKSRSK